MRVLAVSADAARHAPVRALLKGHEVEHVTTPAQSLATIRERRHDVVLVDREIDPPGTDGLALAQQLVQAAPDVPVIVLTHAPDRAADEQAADSGVADFLLVPGLSRDRLAHAIRYAIVHKRALTQSNERHALALQGTNDGVLDWDVVNDRIHFSSRWKTMLGYHEHEIGNTRGEWIGRVHPDDRAPVVQAMETFLNDAGLEHFETEHRMQHRDGTYRWFLARATAVRDNDGKPLRVVGSMMDVTDRHEAEQRLAHDALHDALTGLPNRVLFVDRLDQSIRRAQRHHPESCAAVLFLDLDRFKVINDSMGHACGDELLKAVARRLEAALRPNDTVARLSGDEFTLLLDDVCDPREATVIADRVLASLNEPFVIDGRELFAGASIGIALATAHSKPEQVMRDADVAMYRAKADGKGRHAVFDAAMHAQVERRLRLERELRQAIDDDSIDVGYQPIVQTSTGRIVGFEALCRWPHDDPAELLAIAEETGLAVPLAARVLRTACAQLARWRELPRGAGLTIGVNVTARVLAEPDFLPSLRAALRETALDPRALRLEVSEHDLSRGRADDATRHVLERAHDELQVKAHIDHFGTGASPLRLLHRFPGDAIKISPALVAGIGHDAGAFEIVRAVVGLAHNLGLEVIAEGVAKREQLDYLKVLGCEFAQGFHISATLSAADAEALLDGAAPTHLML